MTTMAYDMTQDMSTMLSVVQYAERAGISDRTVKRWLAADALPGAMKDAQGAWMIPADAVYTPPSPGVVQMLRDTNPGRAVAIPAPQQVSPLGALVELQTAADLLGTTIGGIRRLADAGHLDVGRYGPRGALRVYLPGSIR